MAYEYHAVAARALDRDVIGIVLVRYQVEGGKATGKNQYARLFKTGVQWKGYKDFEKIQPFVEFPAITMMNMGEQAAEGLMTLIQLLTVLEGHNIDLPEA
jgi:hypothetical protein